MLAERGFADSPEATPILERTGDLGWGALALEYGRIYEGVTVTTMGKRDFSKEGKFVRVCGPHGLERRVDDVPREDAGVCLACVEDDVTGAVGRTPSVPSVTEVPRWSIHRLRPITSSVTRSAALGIAPP